MEKLQQALYAVLIWEKKDSLKNGINLSLNEDLKGGNPKYNADKIRNLLNGEIGPFRDIVLLNSGVALFVSGIITSIEEGIEVSKESIDKGKALTSLRKLIEISNSWRTSYKK